MVDVIPFFGARFVAILDFPIYRAASRFDFSVYRALRYGCSHLPFARYALLAPPKAIGITFRIDISDPFLNTTLIRE